MAISKALSFSNVDELFVRIVYSSTLLDEYNNYEIIQDIISISQKNNSLKEIGGEIIWNSTKSSIIQILEGPSIFVNSLYNKIKKDSRHKNITLIACQDITKDEKIYKVWSVSSIKGISSDYKPKMVDFDMKTIIGSGGFSTVIKAYNVIKDKQYAIKVITKKKMTRNLYDSVISEREIWRNLSLKSENHFINKLHWCLQDPLNVYFVMDLANGGDMFDLLKKYKLKSEDCLFYCCEILCALNYIHKNNIVYRDMKLENILLNLDGHIVLTDFGVSEKACKKESKMCGTPQYFSPEMIEHKIIHSKNDIWALGIVIYEMTGVTVPWQGRPKEIMIPLILQSELVLDMNWADYLNILINKCTIKDYEKRPCCEELIEYLISEQIIENWDDVENKLLTPPFIPDNHIPENSNMIVELDI